MATRATRKTGWVTLVGILFLIAGLFNIIWGLAGVGVGLGGTDSTVLGDTDVGNIVFLGIIGLAIGGLQILAAFGIFSRTPSGRILGLVLAIAAVLVNFGYHRVLDGWAFSGLFVNAVIILILCLRAEEFN